MSGAYRSEEWPRNKPADAILREITQSHSRLHGLRLQLHARMGSGNYPMLSVRQSRRGEAAEDMAHALRKLILSHGSDCFGRACTETDQALSLLESIGCGLCSCDVLQEALLKIREPRYWHQGRDRCLGWDGKPCHRNYAASYSLHGAIQSSIPVNTNHGYELSWSALYRLKNHHGFGADGGTGTMEFNDSSTHAEVIRALQAARDDGCCERKEGFRAVRAVIKFLWWCGL